MCPLLLLLERVIGEKVKQWEVDTSWLCRKVKVLSWNFNALVRSFYF
jgi:hypothetical protein